MSNHFDPEEFEHDVRDALHADAEQWAPRDRWEDLWAATRGAASDPSGGRRWPVILTAAATVLAITLAYAVWYRQEPAIPAAPTPSVSASPSPSPTTSSPSPSASPSPTAEWKAPVYYTASIGRVGDPEASGLFRVFQPASLPAADQTGDDVRVRSAVQLSLDSSQLKNAQPTPIDLWPGGRVEAAAVTRRLITLTLSGPGSGKGSGDQVRLAVQQLVWTAQAAVGRGNTPVTFVMADGSPTVQGDLPAAERYVRPDETWRDLAPIWILTPEGGAQLPGGASIEVTGQATVFEATLTVRLETVGGQQITEQSVQASQGAPSRGDWKATFEAPPPGAYRIIAFESSAKDGTVSARAVALVTVK